VVTTQQVQNDINMITQLCCAKPGSVCQIINIKGLNRNRLAELGFSTGTSVTVINHHNHGPLDILVRSSHIALRHEEAESITVKVLNKV
jgi:Fe2+ transport system protein FeoA